MARNMVRLLHKLDPEIPIDHDSKVLPVIINHY